MELPKLDPLLTHNWTTDFGFAYDRPTKKYKVAVSSVDNEMLFRCAIHTVGSDSWRVAKVPCTNVKNGRPPISTDDAGTVHWMTGCNTKKMPKSNECLKCHILSMEVSNEEFRITRDPPDSRIDDDNNSLVELGGSLSLLHYVSRREIDVWVLEDYYGETWQKKYCINISGSRFKCLPWDAHAFAASLEKGEVLIFVGDYNLRRLFSYDPKQQKLIEVKAHLKHIWSWAQLLKFPCTHVESLVTLKSIHAKL